MMKIIVEIEKLGEATTNEDLKIFSSTLNWLASNGFVYHDIEIKETEHKVLHIFRYSSVER